MKVHEAMSKVPATCSPTSTVSEATALLWNHHCSCLPVVDQHNALLGIVTDRELLISLATRNLCPSDLSVGEVMTGGFPVCRTEDDAEDALRLLEVRNLRHLPVLDDAGNLAGILNLTDLILRVRQRQIKAGAHHREPQGRSQIEHALPII